MSTNPDPTPQFEPGGGKLIAVAVFLVVAALAGMVWSFFSRQHAPKNAPPIKARYLPPSERQDAPTAVPPAPTSKAPR